MLRATVVPILWYDKPRTAIDWLEKAFGFEATMVVAGDGDSVIHSELAFGDGAIYVVGPSHPGHPGASPAQVGGRNTAHVHINLKEGLDAHCARARAAGAMIDREPADQTYGDRSYTCFDPEGHSWSFSQPLKQLSVAEMEAATGRKIETPAGG
jgi:uncharacterized glyoxalase superfamily protein PhnB